MMETLLIVAVIVIALAVAAQTVALIGMYLMSRRIGGKVEALIEESKKLQAPIESITNNLKAVSYDLTETGRIAREQAMHVQNIVSETHGNIRDNIDEVRERVLDSVDAARTVVMKPLRQYSAIAAGVAAFFQTLFGGKESETKRPAA